MTGKKYNHKGVSVVYRINSDKKVGSVGSWG